MDKEEIARMSDRYYMYKGLVLAPLASVIGTLVVDISSYLLGTAEGYMTPLFIFIISISYIILFFVGLPIFLLLKYLGFLNIWSLIISAAFIGYLVSITTYSSGLEFAYSVFPAISVAITFWYIYTHRNPNKSLNQTGANNAPPG